MQLAVLLADSEAKASKTTTIVLDSLSLNSVLTGSVSDVVSSPGLAVSLKTL